MTFLSCKRKWILFESEIIFLEAGVLVSFPPLNWYHHVLMPRTRRRKKTASSLKWNILYRAIVNFKSLSSFYISTFWFFSDISQGKIVDIDLATDRLNNMIISHDVPEEFYIVIETGNVWYFHDCQKHLNVSPESLEQWRIHFV